MRKIQMNTKPLVMTTGACLLALGSVGILTTQVRTAHAQSPKTQVDAKTREKEATALPSLGASALGNGKVIDGKVAVTRTSDDFSLKAPTKNVEEFSAKWVTDKSKIQLTVGNAFYVNTPIEFAFKLDKPLQKNQELTIPLKINGTIFNKSSSYDFKDNISQNNGLTYTSKDGSFQYSYDKEKGLLKVKALDDRLLTDYSGLSLFLNNAWVPVPLRANPLLLDGGVAGNYGAKGSGATVKVSMGDQTTSETVTNTENIDFSTNLKPYNDSIFDNGAEYTTQSTARASDIFLGNTHLIKQLKGGKNQQLLDESTSHLCFLESLTRNL